VVQYLGSSTNEVRGDISAFNVLALIDDVRAAGSLESELNAIRNEDLLEFAAALTPDRTNSSIRCQICNELSNCKTFLRVSLHSLKFLQRMSLL